MAEAQDVGRARRRVLMLLENNPYPEDVRVRREADSLVEAGHSVTVIAPRFEAQPWTDEIRGVRVRRYPSPGHARGLLGFAWEYGYSTAAAFVLAWVAFFREGFDVVHAHNPPDTFAFVALPFKLLGRRFVFDQHDLCTEMYDVRSGGRGNRIVRSLLRILELLSLKLADHVVAPNQSYRQLQHERGAVALDRITVVRNGPELDLFRPVAADPTLRRRAPFLLGYVGVMAQQDGVDHLLRSVAHLRERRDDFLSVLIGPGAAVPELQRLARSLDLERFIWFRGSLSGETLVRHIASMDVCLDPDPSNPYNDRSTMIKMTEYMALAKPIVAFDLPEHRVTAGEAAVYVPPNDERAFADAIGSLLDDPDRRARMGRIGRERIENGLSWEHSAKALRAVYEQV